MTMIIMQLKGLLRQSWKDVGKKLQTRLCAATEGKYNPNILSTCNMDYMDG
ncbi:hypothetical protein RO3G_08818 [Rhizopus delemar RA 99-880]|uniref:Uncharacterized protein n=1 Tax=Rhizopus delemar (strain RA 99-880 / ATCC MYA-4621 / FGSC 9543 / NRRL 43880) TaxID=246409 RepID=I1C6M8_RHIO9|nr:hypothetical protein RO3G_08818 [Rhizopus delemar RA 99-880]|eukprot:EIE84108.1 hypothetical protein RO3G_08818 [Rhizopus delemar RA 99-880]